MLRRLFTWLRDFEPAQLNALKAAALAILAAVGVTLSTDLQAEIGFWIGVAGVVLTQVQAILTRFGVFAPSTVRELTSEE